MAFDWFRNDEQSESRKRARLIEDLRQQLVGRAAPSVPVRLQLCDLLIQANRGAEAVPVLLGLADEFAADGFVAKAVAILKRVEKMDPGPHVENRLAKLVSQQQRVQVPLVLPQVAPAAEDEAPLAPGAEPVVAAEAAPETPSEPAPAEAAPAAAEAAPAAAEPSPPPESPATVPVELAPPSPATVPVELPPAAPATAAEPEPEPVEEVEAAAVVEPQPAGSVGQRIRGAFRRFLASLGEDAEPAAVVEPEPLPEPAEPPKAEAPAVPAPAEPAVEVEPVVEPEPADEGPALSQEAYADRLMDIVEEVLHRPPDPVATRVRPLAAGEVLAFAERLLGSRLFADLSEEELLAVVRVLVLHVCEPGDIVVTEGEPGHSLFLIASGRVKVSVGNPEGRNFAVSSLGEGDFFGEISSMSGRPRTATVVAATRCELLELDKVEVDRIAAGHPRVREILETAYIKRSTSPEAVAVRMVPLAQDESRPRAQAVLEAHFGESHWDPRMRLRLADLLLKAGKSDDAVPILAGLADELAHQGFPEKAIAILKRIERVRRQQLEEVNLAPLRPLEAEPVMAAPLAEPAAGARPWQGVTDDNFHGWVVDLVRDAVERRATGGTGPLRGWGPGVLASPLFEDFTEDDLLAFIHGLRLLTFEGGDVILTEGEAGQSVFIVAAGLVKVFIRDPRRANRPVCALGEGAFFGEISALSGRPRSATVTAAGPCELLEMSRAALDQVAATHPHLRAVLEEYTIRRATDPVAEAIRAARVRPA